MAGNNDILSQMDANMKEINEKARGRTSFKRGILNIIAEFEAAVENRRKSEAAGTPELERGEELIKKGSEAQGKKRKRTDKQEIRPLDADGVHQPVRISTWVDDRGPLEDGGNKWDRRYCSLDY